jgi:8-oxo-dGTP pyrophosphatase MutT (NUDIX family)
LIFCATFVWDISHSKKNQSRYYHKGTSVYGSGSSVGIATGDGLDGPGIESRWGEIFRTWPDRPWGPPSLLYNGYWVFPGGKVRPGRGADHSPPSSAVVMEE